MHSFQYWSLPLIYNSGHNPDLLIFLARLPVMLLLPLLALMIFSWTRRLYNLEAAFFATFLALFSPNLMAHARLAATDFITAVTFFGAVFSFWIYVRKRSFYWLMICGAATGLALMAKFTAVLLFPIYLILIILVNAKNLSSYNFLSIAKSMVLPKTEEQKNRGLTMAPLVMIFLISLFVIWACYFFEYRPIDSVPLSKAAPPEQTFGGIMKLILDKQIKLPAATYITALYEQAVHNSAGHRNYFLGTLSRRGSWFYFPLAFLIKTPIPTLIVLLITAIFSFRRKSQKRVDEAFLLIPVLFLFLVSIISNINIGLRLILPIFPFLFVWAGKVITVSSSKHFRRLLALLLLWYAGANLFIFPHYLEYFNEFIGGPKNGYKYLVDSNLDWGQDLKLLEDYARRNNITSLKLVYFGTPRLTEFTGFYNSAADSSPQKGYLAISATHLRNVYLPPGSFDWLKNYQPIDRIAYSIFIYKIPASQNRPEPQ